MLVNSHSFLSVQQPLIVSHTANSFVLALDLLHPASCLDPLCPLLHKGIPLLSELQDAIQAGVPVTKGEAAQGEVLVPPSAVSYAQFLHKMLVKGKKKLYHLRSFCIALTFKPSVCLELSYHSFPIYLLPALCRRLGLRGEETQPLSSKCS